MGGWGPQEDGRGSRRGREEREGDEEDTGEGRGKERVGGGKEDDGKTSKEVAHAGMACIASTHITFPCPDMA